MKIDGPLSDLLCDRLVVLVAGKTSPTTELLARYRCRGGLLLKARDSTLAESPASGWVSQELCRPKQIHTNNCQLAILDKLQANLLLKKYKFRRFKYIAFRINWGLLAALPLLTLHTITGKLAYLGVSKISLNEGQAFYFLFRNRLKNKDLRRQYLPTNRTILEGLSCFSDLSLVTLRNHESIRDGTHNHDVDTLVASSEAEAVIDRLGREVGTRPIDIYTDDGTQGFNLNGAAYFAPTVARQIIENSAIERDGMRSPNRNWLYLSYAYHVIFHGKLKDIAAVEGLSAKSFTSPRHWEELTRLAMASGRKAPETLDQLLKDLTAADAMPSDDLIWFYAKSDAFLKSWLGRKPKAPAGLVTFFIRDFGIGDKSVEIVRGQLAKNFKIIFDSPLSGDSQRAAVQNIRGGNWYDRDLPGGFAPPVHWFVVWDADVQPPGWLTRRKWPNLDNRRILLKENLRKELSGGGKKSSRVIHSSDNSAEAISHIRSIEFAEKGFVIETAKGLGVPPECFEIPRAD